jgi:Domain of unknown function (DUF5134)
MANHVPMLSDLLTVAMLGIAMYCIGRLVVSLAQHRKSQHDADAVHTLMGVSMAGMLSPSLAAVPTGLWVTVFCATTFWFGWRVVHDTDHDVVASPIGQHLAHLLMSAAMVYMLVVAEWAGPMRASTAATSGMAGMSMGADRWPLVTIVVAVLLLGDGVFTFGLNIRSVVSQRVATELALAPVGGGDVPGGPQQILSGTRAGSSLDSPTVVFAPRSAMLCQLVMSLVMGYMLLTLL